MAILRKQTKSSKVLVEDAEENPLLGKRHVYANSRENGLKTQAKALGFTEEEIKRLQQIYTAKTNKII